MNDWKVGDEVWWFEQEDDNAVIDIMDFHLYHDIIKYFPSGDFEKVNSTNVEMVESGVLYWVKTFYHSKNEAIAALRERIVEIENE